MRPKKFNEVYCDECGTPTHIESPRGLCNTCYRVWDHERYEDMEKPTHIKELINKTMENLKLHHMNSAINFMNDSLFGRE